MFWRRVFRKALPVARVGAYGICVFTLIGGLAARSVYGDVREQTFLVGRELASMKDLVGESHKVMINGEPMFVGAAVIDSNVGEVLDRFEKLCKENSQGLDEALTNPADFPEKTREALKKLGATGLGILRYEHGGEGSIACLAHQGGGGVKGLTERLKAFSKSLDLADVGKLRYAYARPTDNGRVQVVTAWTDGSLKIGNMFPVDGSEPPGTDVNDVPRPEGSQRLLTAEVAGAPYGIHIYTAPGKPDEVLRAYDALLPKGGWQAQEWVAKGAPGTRAFHKDERDVLVFADPDGEKSAVSIIEMRAKAP